MGEGENEALWFDGYVIPYAVDVATGRLVDPITATYEAKYRCPECLSLVTLRAPGRSKDTGEIVSNRCFAHDTKQGDGRAESCSGGTGQGVVLKTAKTLVHQTIQDSIAGMAPRPRFLDRCASCTGDITRTLSEATAVKTEHTLKLHSLSGNTPHLYVTSERGGGVIEVCEANKIDRTVAATYEGNAEVSWWIEIDATSVVEGHWMAVRTSRPTRCSKCLPPKKDRQREAAQQQPAPAPNRQQRLAQMAAEQAQPIVRDDEGRARRALLDLPMDDRVADLCPVCGRHMVGSARERLVWLKKGGTIRCVFHDVSRTRAPYGEQAQGQEAGT